MTNDDHVALLNAAARGERAAARRLIDEVGPVVYGFVYLRVGGDDSVAEDLVQETFLQAIESADGFRGESSLTTWMCTIARRQLARYYEAERKQATSRLELVPVVDLPMDAPVDAVDDREAMASALRRLPVLHRQVLVLKYLDERSVEEIASELGRTRVQVQSLLQRARGALRSQLEAIA